MRSLHTAILNDAMNGLASRIIASLVAALSVISPANAQLGPPELDPSEIPIALLVDASTGQVLFERQSERRFVPASITKVMTLYTAFELMEQGLLTPTQTLTVSERAWTEWSGQGSTMFLNAGDRVPLRDLLTGIATVSANDASIVLAEGALGSVPAWTAQMNTNAVELGMTQSHFGTPNGWPDEGRTFTTAHDLARLARRLIEKHPSKFSQFIGRPEFRYGRITQRNHDPMIGRVRGADGIKTGYTNEAGFGFLGTAKRGDQRLILVVAGGETYGSRARAARALIEWGFSAFNRRELFEQGARVGEAKVQNGTQRRLGLVTGAQVSVNLPKGSRANLAAKIVYDGPLRAPIAMGDKVATLEISAPNMATARVPLFAQNSVSEAGVLDRIANAFAGWFG